MLTCGDHSWPRPGSMLTPGRRRGVGLLLQAGLRELCSVSSHGITRASAGAGLTGSMFSSSTSWHSSFGVYVCVRLMFTQIIRELGACLE